MDRLSAGPAAEDAQRNDPLILPAADLRYFDACHFALDEDADAIAEAIIETFSR